jgi:serine/threonine-protein kinase
MSNQSDRNDGVASPVRSEPAPTSVERKSERPSVRPGGPESLVGTTLGGRYLIEKLLGEGGMGAVYQAEHTHMRKRLAVKVLHPEMSRLPEVVARFEREAMAAAHIEHPNVAAATDFGKLDDGSFFLVLEYVEGKSLRDAIAVGPMELGRTLHIARQTASALARAHALGIVHRDLKPENIMLVAREGDANVVKVLDFGIAKVPI